MKLLLYCTKAKPYLADFKGDYQTYSNGKELDELFDKGFNPNDIMNILNGKIVAECDYDVEEIEYKYTIHTGYSDVVLKTNRLTESELFNKSCLNFFEITKYFNKPFRINEKGHCGYAIHIKNLHIFDKPRELRFYYQKYKNDKHLYNVEKAPQNMMKVIGKQGDEYILIPIRPERLCKILNGEKTIEVRKKVLKEML